MTVFKWKWLSKYGKKREKKNVKVEKVKKVFLNRNYFNHSEEEKKWVTNTNVETCLKLPSKYYSIQLRIIP